MIIRVGGAARKGNLPGVRTHPRRPFDEHDLRTLRTVPNQDQHRRGPSTDSWPDGDDLIQPGPLRQGVHEGFEPLRSLRLTLGHGVTPRYLRARSRTSVAELNGPACR